MMREFVLRQQIRSSSVQITVGWFAVAGSQWNAAAQKFQIIEPNTPLGDRAADAVASSKSSPDVVG